VGVNQNEVFRGKNRTFYLTIMSGVLESQIVLLRKDPDYFRAAVTFTARRTAFTPRLVEKDYLCTVLLEYLTATGGRLVFKGGTCLSKVHAGYRSLPLPYPVAIVSEDAGLGGVGGARAQSASARSQVMRSPSVPVSALY
jgi:hypothetical protein